MLFCENKNTFFTFCFCAFFYVFPMWCAFQAHLRNVFYRMGFGDQEIVALSGAHTIGRAHKVLPFFPAALSCTGRLHFSDLEKQQRWETLILLDSNIFSGALFSLPLSPYLSLSLSIYTSLGGCSFSWLLYAPKNEETGIIIPSILTLFMATLLL